MCVQVVKPVRADRDAVAPRGGCYFSPFGDPSAYQGVGLQDLRGPLVENLLEVPASGAYLAGGDRDASELGQARVVVDVVREERLFDPVGIIELEAFHVA